MTARQITKAKGLAKDWQARIAHNLVPPSPMPMPAAGPVRASGAKR